MGQISSFMRNILILLFLILQSEACLATLSRGQQWQRNHEVSINAFSEMAWAAANNALIEEIGFTNYLILGENASNPNLPTQMIGYRSAAGQSWQICTRNLDPSWYSTNMQGLIAAYPGNIGWNIGDEVSENLDSLGSLLDSVRTLAADPNILISSSLASWDNFPNWTWQQYSDFVHSWITTVRPDAVIYVLYPFYDNGLATNFYQQLKLVRDEAVANNVPYWAWVQSFGFIPSYAPHYEPSESDMRFQVFMSLTFGYSGISYWAYDSAYMPYTKVMLDGNGNPTTLYDYAKAINKEVKMWGNTLAFLKSTSVGWVQGGNAAPVGLSNWQYGDGGDTHITNITVNNAGTTKNGVIGIFSDDLSDRYFVLTNADRAYDSTATQTSTSFTITFDNTVYSLLTLDRNTGWLKRIWLVNHQYTFTLPGGTGDIFKYDNGRVFPGSLKSFDCSAVFLPTDLNQDCQVDLHDMEVIISNWLESSL